MPTNTRTRIEFSSPLDVWEIVEQWAEQAGYRLVQQDESSRLYQRGPGIRYQGAAQKLKVMKSQDHYVLEAWIAIRVSRLTRILATSSAVMRAPNEMAIDSGGPAAVITSARARQDVNGLLARLGVEDRIS